MSTTVTTPKDLSQVKMPFPWKLYHMLGEAEKEELGFSNVVSWLPDGQAFKIYDEPTFVETVMKTYFNQTKIKSFTRQLYIYGFLKIGSGPNEGAFYHPEFLRSNKESCYSIKRNQAGDRRRTKVSRRGSTSSYSSASSYESYDSGPAMTPPAYTGSTRAQRRSSLSDYNSGRPPQPLVERMPQTRRSSMGAPIPYEYTPVEGRNSLSDFFDKAVSLLPNDGAYADLPCVDALEPTPLPENFQVHRQQQQQLSSNSIPSNNFDPISVPSTIGGNNMNGTLNGNMNALLSSGMNNFQQQQQQLNNNNNNDGLSNNLPNTILSSSLRDGINLLSGHTMTANAMNGNLMNNNNNNINNNSILNNSIGSGNNNNSNNNNNNFGLNNYRNPNGNGSGNGIPPNQIEFFS